MLTSHKILLHHFLQMVEDKPTQSPTTGYDAPLIA